MNTCKLIFRNVCKNIRDYLIYFLTLTLSVSLFYAFNSISDQPAFSNMGMTGTLLYRQLGIMLSTLSTMIAVVLAFLILYANQFLLKRRKKESSTPSPKTQNGNIFYECKFTKDPGSQNVVDEEKRQLKELGIPYDRLAAFGDRFRFPFVFSSTGRF